MSQTTFGSDYLPTVSSIMVKYLTNVRQFTPTFDNFIFLTWLKLIHPKLPKLVKHIIELSGNPEPLYQLNLKYLKPQTISSLLDETHVVNNAKMMHTAITSSLKPANIRTRHVTHLLQHTLETG